MQSVWKTIRRVLIAVYLIAIHALLLYFVGERVLNRFTEIQSVDTRSVGDPTERKSIPTPPPVPERFADPPDSIPQTAPPDSGQPIASSPGLMIPVVGVKPEQLIDTFSSSRSEGRFHDSIDIPAAAGTPVVAATDGEIMRFWDGERGGITIYQRSADQKFILYYAHLQRRADEIAVGMTVKKGSTIGFVGDTGNAGLGNYHLHFSIARINDPKRFWEGTYLNPYPLLRNGLYPE